MTCSSRSRWKQIDDGGLPHGTVSTSTRLGGLAILLFLMLGSRSLQAARGYAIEIVLTYDSPRKFKYLATVDAREGAKIEFDPTSALKPHVLDARKKLATKRGYSPKIYGQDFYKILSIKRVEYKVTEVPGGRIVVEK